MTVCSTTFFKEDNPEKSAIRIHPAQDGGHRITVCDQYCRKCVDECPTMAISVSKQGVVLINKSICIGCFACVAVCPVDAMMRLEGGLTPFKCIACGSCAKQCPAGALEIVTEEQ